jgi:hypothetical protein
MSRVPAFFLLLLLLPPTPGSVLARQGGPAARPVRVAGTKVSLVPPAGFAPSAQFTGYARAEEAASIVVTELPFALTQATQPLTNPEGLKSRALTLLSKESVTVGGTAGLLLHLRQTASGVEYLKWLLLVGDDAATVMVTATFPAESEGQLSAPLRQSVLTTRWDKDAEVAAGEGLRYTVGERGALKFAKRIGNTLMYTGGGVFPSPAADDPLFVVGPSFAEVAAADRKGFAEGRVAATVSVTDIVARKTEPLSVAGLGGYETLADAKDKVTGEPMVVYQVILFDGPYYYLMQGLVSRKLAGEHLPSFKEMAKSFRRR